MRFMRKTLFTVSNSLLFCLWWIWTIRIPTLYSQTFSCPLILNLFRCQNSCPSLLRLFSRAKDKSQVKLKGLILLLMLFKMQLVSAQLATLLLLSLVFPGKSQVQTDLCWSGFLYYSDPFWDTPRFREEWRWRYLRMDGGRIIYSIFSNYPYTHKGRGLERKMGKEDIQMKERVLYSL